MQVRGNRLLKFLDRYLGIPLIFSMGVFRKKNLMPPKRPSNILMVKLSALGDTILAVPAIRAARQQFPEAKITFIGGNTNEEILRRCSYIDQVYIFERKEILANPGYLFRFIRNLRTVNYDLVIHFGQWERLETILVGLSKGKFKIGFKTNGQRKHWVYDRSVEHSPDKHEVDSFALLIELAGVSPNNDDKLEFWLTPKEEKWAEAFWEKNNLNGQSVICIHPCTGRGGYRSQREWPMKNYIRLIKRINSFYRNRIRIIVTGSEEERLKIDKLQKMVKCIDLVGHSIGKVAAVIRRSDLLICGNTGITHVGAAVGIKVLEINGPVNFKKWKAWGKKHILVQSRVKCAPCGNLGFEYAKCANAICMNAISPDEVFENVQSALRT